MLGRWTEANGVSARATHHLGQVTQEQVLPYLHAADVAVFPNRAEGGTNLVAMEVSFNFNFNFNFNSCSCSPLPPTWPPYMGGAPALLQPADFQY
jgi:hypothetical protein